MTRSFTPIPLTSREVRWLIAVFVLTLPAVTARLYSSDEVQYFSYLRSLWFDRDVSFENEYRHFYDSGVARTEGFRETFLVPLTQTGKRENFATLGCAILWAPFYAVADVVTRALRAGGASLEADGYSRVYVAAVAYGSALYGFLALLLSAGLARRLTGDGMLAMLAIWFGTPLLFYMYAAPPFSHACSAFAVALFITVWIHVREQWSPRGFVHLGAAAALMTMVREQDVFYAVGPAVDFLAAAVKDSRFRSQLRGVAAGLLAFAIAYSPQLFAYWSLNGRLGPSRLVTRKMTWTAPHALEVLASPQHGLFVWTPLALLAVAGLVLLWRNQAHGATRARAGVPATVDAPRRLAACLLLIFALQVYVSGSVESWTVAGAFGQRRFVGATALLVIGLAALWRTLRPGAPRAAIATLGALAIWWNIGLMALFGAGLMDRQRLDLPRNAHGVFVTLPLSAPSLVYRYLFNRDSFYKAPE